MGSTAAYGVLLLGLVAIIYSEDHAIQVPLTVLGVLGLVLAAVMAAVRRRWTGWLGAGFGLVGLVADAPHQLPGIIHPQDAGHFVVGGILILAGVLAVLLGVRAATLRA